MTAGRAGAFDVAVVGMACAFPGAPDLARYWSNVLAGTSSVTEVDPARWPAELYYGGAGARPGEQSPSKWGGFLPRLPFDALAHGIPPASLGSIEPAQLLALEIATRALADAGYRSRSFDRETTSVVFAAEAGADLAATYGIRSLLPMYTGSIPPALDAKLPRLTEDSFAGTLANVIAGRIANRLDLGGVNYAVDAACASSLAALDQACKELLAGTSDMVLCGAVDVHNGIHDYLMFGSVQALSPSGQSRCLDSDADGIVLGEGVACLVLKRLADAERDGDRVYAVVKGVAGASDGRSRGITAPRPEGQRRAIERALRRAGVAASEIGLVEAHATGTVVGDRTELGTLTEVFLEGGAAPGSCAIGSVKSLIGHTKCAAGLAGLIKAALALHTGVRPPSPHVRQPNRYWEAATSPFVFDTAARPWLGHERFAGVSAIGFGGINYHAVLASHGEPAAAGEWPAELLLFGGGHAEVRAGLDRLAGMLDEPVRLSDLARTFAFDGPARVAIVATDVASLREQVSAARRFEEDPGRGVYVGDAVSRRPKVAVLFPGQGSQRPGMLADLFVRFPRLRRFLRSGARWADTIYPPAAFGDEREAEVRANLTDTRNAQPALGIVELAAWDCLASFGVRPDMAGGHSYGEVVALAAAGALPVADVLPLSAARAQAMGACPGGERGTMVAVNAPASQVLDGLGDEVVVANHNAPDQVVISGPVDAVGRAASRLRERGLTVRPLRVGAGFHSPLMAGAAEQFGRVLAERDFQAPAIPVWSNATARPYPDEPDAIRALLADQLTMPVRFVEQIEAMYAAGARVFVEAGPGGVLTRLVGQVLGDRPHTAVACDTANQQGLPAMLAALARLAVSGVPVSASAAFAGRETAGEPGTRAMWTVDGHLVRTRDGEPVAHGLTPGGTPVALHQSERDATVIEFLRGTQEIVAAQQAVMLRYLGAGAGVGAAEQATAPVRRQPAPPVVTGTVLDLISERTGYPPDMLDPDLDLEEALGVDSLKRTEIAAALLGPDGDATAFSELRTIRAMTQWLGERSEPDVPRYVIRFEPRPGGPAERRSISILGDGQGLAAALTAITGTSSTPDTLVDLRALDPGDGLVLPQGYTEIRAAVLGGIRRLVVVTRHATGVSGAGMAGLVRTIRHEYPDLDVVAVDVEAGQSPARTAQRIAGEFGAPDPVVAYQGGVRGVWRTVPEPLPATVPTAESLGLDSESVVLLVGGGRGITARVAAALAKTTGCRLELFGRTPFPDGPTGPADTDLIRRALIEQGGRTPARIEEEVRRRANAAELQRNIEHLPSARYHQVDVRDAARVRAAVREIYRHHGRLDAVVYGAGSLRDQLIRDTTTQAFAEVFAAKVDGARALVEELRPDLRYLVLFDSVAGVFGNRGQAGYAAANDALATLAGSWRGRFDGRVVSVAWGPWSAAAGGMVSAELARDYERRGIGLIEPDQGVDSLLRELADGDAPHVLYLNGDIEAFAGRHHA